jgi:hypothetical protein
VHYKGLWAGRARPYDAGDSVGCRTECFGAIDIDVERDPEPGTGLRGIRLWIESVASGQNYTVELRNPHASDAASYEAWTGSQGWWCNISGSSNNQGTLSDAGCCRSVLTVGATRKVIPPNPATGEAITSYSGAGPTMDGRIKPEIVAVGGEDTTNGLQPQLDILYDLWIHVSDGVRGQPLAKTRIDILTFDPKQSAAGGFALSASVFTDVSVDT